MTVHNSSVVTRFPPSPTGYLHIGGARTALFSWLFAKKHKGKFVLRIEDTDLERSTEESVQAIFDGMNWLDLPHDDGPYYQTQRFDRYKAVIEQLLAEGKAYRCTVPKAVLDAQREEQIKNKQAPRYNGHCRDMNIPADCGEPFVVRFKNPLEGDVVFDDAVKGQISISNTELDDLIIARSDGTPTYNLTVVVDDIDMGMTHIIRGDDHVNNTPRQINLYKALGAKLPIFAHVPMILGEDGKRLSKRHGAVGVMQYYEEGYLPEALLNYLVRLGWSNGDQEIFSRDEMIEAFSLEGINKSASTFNPEKLLWLNQHYIKTGDPKRIGTLLADYAQKQGFDLSNGPAPEAFVSAFSERVSTMVEMASQAKPYYTDFDEYDAKAEKRHFKPTCIEALETLKAKYDALDNWQGEILHTIVQDTANELDIGMGKVGVPLRVAVCGVASSPAIDVTLELMGRDRTLARLEKAIAYLMDKRDKSA